MRSMPWFGSVFGLVLAGTAVAPVKAEVVGLTFKGNFNFPVPYFGLQGVAVPYEFAIVYDTALDTNAGFYPPGSQLGPYIAGSNWHAYSRDGIVSAAMRLGTAEWSPVELTSLNLGGGADADFWADTDIAVATPTGCWINFENATGRLELGFPYIGGDSRAYTDLHAAVWSTIPPQPQVSTAVTVTRSVAPTLCGPDTWLAAPAEGIPGVDFGLYDTTEWDPDGDGPRGSVLVLGGEFVFAGQFQCDNIALTDGVEISPLGTGIVGYVGAVTTWDPDGPGPLSPLLVAGGQFSQAGGVACSGIASWNGATWQALSSGLTGNGAINTMTSWDPDGLGPTLPLLVAAGFFTQIDGAAASNIAAWNGTQWSELGGGISGGQVRDLFIWDRDGTGPGAPLLLACGDFNSAGGVQANRIAAWNGSAWQPLGTGVEGSVNRMSSSYTDPDCPGVTDLLIAGDFGSVGGVTMGGLARWNGVQWMPIGSGTDIAGALADVQEWDPDGAGPLPPELHVCGFFRAASDPNRDRFWARRDGAVWTILDRAGVTPALLDTWDPDGSGPLDTHLMLSGGIRAEGDQPGRGITLWNGTGWRPIAQGDAGLRILAAQNWDPDGPGPLDERVFVGGLFINIGNVPTLGIAQWDGVQWDTLEGGVSLSGTPSDRPVRSMFVSDIDGPGPIGANLIVGGRFNRAGILNTQSIARWDGVTWHDIGGGLGAEVVDMTEWDPDGHGPLWPQLVTAGDPSTAFRRWDGSAWQTIGGGTNGLLNAVESWDRDGAGPQPAVLIVGGVLNLAGGSVAVNNIAQWDGVSWQALGSGVNDDVKAMATWDRDGIGPLNPVLIVGGEFAVAGGVPAATVAQWDGSTWQAMGLGLQGRDTAVLREWDRDGPGPLNPLMIAGGAFGNNGTPTPNFLASWNGTTWQDLAGSTSGGTLAQVLAITPWDPDGPGPGAERLVVGGEFLRAGTVISSLVAQYGQATSLWGGAASGSYSDQARWSCGLAPGRLDRVVFDALAAGYTPSGFTVTLPTGMASEIIRAEAMRIRTDVITLDMAGRSMTLNPDEELNDPSLVIGNIPDQSASLRIRSASTPSIFTANSVVLGDVATPSPRTSQLLVETGNALFRAEGDLVVGRRGNKGVLTVQTSGDVEVLGDMSVASELGSVGEVRVTGAGSRIQRPFLSSQPNLTIGDRGSATWSVLTSAITDVGNLASFTMGAAPGSSGLLSITGNGEWFMSGNKANIGLLGTGSITVQSGGELITDMVEEFWIGRTPTGSGSIIVSGPTSEWREGIATIRIGPTGMLAIINSATFRAPGLAVNPGGLLRGNGVLLGPVSGGNQNVINIGTIDPSFDQTGAGAGVIEITGDLLMCDVDCAPVGACCLPDGSCNDSTGAACFAQGGTFHPGVLCAECPCDQPGRTSIESGELALDIFSSTLIDTMVVDGQASLAGALTVTRDPAFSAVIDQDLTILTAAGGIDGFFDVAFLPPTGDPGTFLLAQPASNIVASESTERGVPTIIAGPLTNPANGNTYYRLSVSTWTAAQAFAQTLGGHLVTIDDAAENLWVATNMTANNRCWIGLNRAGGAPEFTWVSGSTATFRQWEPGEPNNAGGSEFFVEMYGTGGNWNDGPDFGTFEQQGIVEVPAGPINTAVVLTVQQLQSFINTSAANTDILPGVPAAAVVADLDGINGPDIAVVIPDSANPTGAPGELVLLMNQGVSGGWQGWSTVQLTDAVGRNPRGIDAAQIDGGPGLDLVVADANDNTVSVLRNNGTGLFLPRMTYSVGQEPRSVTASDFDGDGFADVATANTAAGTISLLRNQGGAWLGLGQSLGDQRVDLNSDPSSLNPRPIDITSVQLNAEAGAEIAVANEGASGVSIFANDPGLLARGATSTWVTRWNLPPVAIPTTQPPSTIRPGNMDEDKWDDLVVTSEQGDTASLILNDRDVSDAAALLTFRPSVDVPAGDSPTSIVPVDLDEDGDLDLAIATTDESAAHVVRVLRNDAPADGQVTLSISQDLQAGENPAIVLAGNVDSDVQGRDDLIVLSSGASLVGRDGRAGPTAMSESRVFISSPEPCPGDGDGSGAVNFADVAAVLANFGAAVPPYTGGDADGSGVVTFADLATVLANFGIICP